MDEHDDDLESEVKEDAEIEVDEFPAADDFDDSADDVQEITPADEDESEL